MTRTAIEDARKYLCDGEDAYITKDGGWSVYNLNNRLAKALVKRYDEASKTEQKKILGVLDAMNLEHLDLVEYRSDNTTPVYAYEPTGYENPVYVYDYLDKFVPKYLGLEYILQDIPF